MSTGERRRELLKCVLPLRVQIKGLMTSKGPGPFLSVLPGAQTNVCWAWTFPASFHSLLRLSWTAPRGQGLHVVQVVKAKSLGALRQTEPSGPGSDLICAGQETQQSLLLA